MGSSSLTRDQTQAPCIGTSDSEPPDHQGSHLDFHKIWFHLCSETVTRQVQFVLQVTNVSRLVMSDSLLTYVTVFSKGINSLLHGVPSHVDAES